MHGYIGVTDPGWWEHLRQTPEPQEANFWSPSTRQRRLALGTPFFFKLRAPHRAVAGFGYFAGFSVLPDWLAWETFGAANGVASLDELRRRLSRIRQRNRMEDRDGGEIGCAMIAEAVLFPESDWVDPPADWASQTVSGKAYDLTSGEGARIWTECRARVLSGRAGVAEEAPRYGAPQLQRPRLGQRIFRIRVLDAYGRSCAITTEHSLPVLDAAHIHPYADGGPHEVTNGLALRTDLHRLFDRGYVTLDENERLVVSRRLQDRYGNGKVYYGLEGRRLTLPTDPRVRPSPRALRWHRERVFVG
ncbi:MAG: HNH endonuclease [Sandaracinaceae bacterium]